MWDKWKKKIQNFIWEEVEENETKTIQQEKDEELPNLEAKMVYQYPNRASFQIPSIPDPVERKDKTEIPAYKRRTNRDQNSSIQVNQSISKRRERTPREMREQTLKQGQIDETKKPFKSSDVPSPIYGFHSRHKEKEVESVPAYIRKKDKRSEPITNNVNEDPTLEVVAVNMDTENNQLTPNHIDDRVIDQVVHKEQVNDNPPLDSESTIISNSEDKQRPVKSQTERREFYKSERRSSQAIPYNVMMTPRDKKNHFEKSKVGKKVGEQSVEEKVEVASLPFHLLNDTKPKSTSNDLWVKEQQALLEKTLKYFNVKARVVQATQGPSVTRFEIQPELGVKVSKIKNLSDDLKLNMSARDIRIEAPIPGKNTVGIEVPNPQATMVNLQDIVESNVFTDSGSPLTIALGLSIEGSPIVTNIQKMPHGLIAGATGSGKSVCINTILVSLIYKANHKDVKFLLIDPKMVELAPYNGIPHLVSPVITDVKAATAALKWAVAEMEERYDKFVHEGVRDIGRYNQKIKNELRHDEKMPYIVIVIDELADLMMVSPQDVEDAICRIAQKARACGIHLLLATQRPSVDVLTGLIKANIPTRIAFSVSSQVDSRTIIDTGGAEKLLGKGDMLFIENGAGKSVRIQGPFVSDDEIERVTNYARKMAAPDYLFEQETLLQQMTIDEEEDELLQEVIEFILEQNSASTSLLQRHFKIGYNRAARLIDSLEGKGIISGQNGSKPRDILITPSQLGDFQ